MNRRINLVLLFVILVFFSLPVYSNGRDFDLDEEGVAKDCEFLFILTEDLIDKYSLPSLTFVSSVDLPSRTRGKSIDIAGECGDPNETLLVLVKRKGRGSGEVLLSYNRDLQLIGELRFDEEDNDDDEEEDNNDDEEDNDNDD